MYRKIIYTTILATVFSLFTGSVLQAQCNSGQIPVIITIQTDVNGYQTYWELKENGLVVGSGGNPQVVPGSQQLLGFPFVPGSYDDLSTYADTVCVSDQSTLDFTIMDDWGDGLLQGGYSVTVDGCEWEAAGAAEFDIETYIIKLPLPQNNILIASTNLERPIPGGSCLTGSLVNRAANVLTSFELLWQIDGGPVYSRSYQNLSIPCGGNFDFTSDAALNLTSYGSRVPITVWTASPNGQPDAEPTDNMVNAKPLITQGIVTHDKGVLMEQFAGAWNIFDVDGIYASDTLLENYPYRVFAANIHFADSMEFPGGAQIQSQWGSFFPGAMFDRFFFEGDIEVNQSRSVWESRIEERLQESTQVCVSVDCAFDEVTRSLYVIVDVEAVDYLDSSDYRIHVHAVENGVTGTGPGYDQANFYGSFPFSPNHPYFNQPDPIVGFVHDRVLRATIAGANGDSTTLPNQLAPGMYSKVYQYTVPADFDESNMYLLAFVERYDPDPLKHEVLNVIQSKPGGSINPCNTVSAPICSGSMPSMSMAPNTTPPKEVKLGGNKTTADQPGASSEVLKEFHAEVYPNPSADKVYIQTNFDLPEMVTIRLYDAMGRQVVTTGEMRSNAGSNTYFIDGKQLPSGMYHMMLTTASGRSLSEQVMISK